VLNGDFTFDLLDFNLRDFFSYISSDIVWPTKIVLPSIRDHIVLKQRWRDNAGPAPNICTNSCNESSGRSVGSALHLRNKLNKCMCIKYVSWRY